LERSVKYESINPATGETVERYATATDDQWKTAVERAHAAFLDWRSQSLDARGRVLSRTAELLEGEASELAALMALEMGKPVAEGEAEAKKCAWACRYFAEQAASFLGDESKPSDGSDAWVRYDPIGTVLAIMPWNFPFWQFFRFAAPALMVGNTVLLKHAPNTPGCALRIERLLADAGLPQGVVQNLFLTNEQAAEVIGDRRVGGVTLTGSTRAGQQVAAVAGRHLKTMVMELGGSDPFVVFDDADLDRAIETAVASRCLNNGQSCIAAKRFIVQQSVFDRFRDGVVERMRSRKMGDPGSAGVELGPLARRDLRDHLADQVERSVASGARALCGGEVPAGKGWFYPATVLVDAPDGSPPVREELFGPVATLFPFRREDEAVTMANHSDYGLGASVWSGDRERVERLLPLLETGSVFVNGLVKSDPRLPFGGVKDSGFGRELAREGMLEFVNQKTVWIG
jgi:succinate-semialdehyde dehydrogenase/glutarate-semialdehyde dehydrogenase